MMVLIKSLLLVLLYLFFSLSPIFHNCLSDSESLKSFCQNNRTKVRTGTLEAKIFLNSVDKLLDKSDTWVEKQFGTGKITILPSHFSMAPGPTHYRDVEHKTVSYQLLKFDKSLKPTKIGLVVIGFKNHIVSSITLNYSSSVGAINEENNGTSNLPAQLRKAPSEQIAENSEFDRTHISNKSHFLRGYTESARWKYILADLLRLNALNEEQIVLLFGECFYNSPSGGGYPSISNFSMEYRLAADKIIGNYCLSKMLTVFVKNKHVTTVRIENQELTVY